MLFKDFMKMYDNWNDYTKVNDNDLQTVVRAKTEDIMDGVAEFEKQASIKDYETLYNSEVIAFGFYDDEFTVRVSFHCKKDGFNVENFKFTDKYYDAESKEITFYFSGPEDAFDWDPKIFEFAGYSKEDVVAADLSVTIAAENENKMYINEFHPVSVESSPVIEQLDGSFLSLNWKDCDLDYEDVITLLKTVSTLAGIEFDY